jgi:hypothetical protein
MLTSQRLPKCWAGLSLRRKKISGRQSVRLKMSLTYIHSSAVDDPPAKVAESLEKIPSRWTRAILLSMIACHIRKMEEASQDVEQAAVVFYEILTELKS